MGAAAGGSAWAAAPSAGTDELMLDSTALIQLEQRAKFADPREQCYLYSEVLHGLTELAGRQIASGEEDEARLTMMRIDAVTSDAAAIVRKSSARNTHRIKNAEMLMEHTTHRLQDMARVVSSEEQTAMQATLKRLTAVHNDLLALIFSR